jgi:hypothetical protein
LLIWRLGLMLGSANALYFTVNAFIPRYFDTAGGRDLIHPALCCLKRVSVEMTNYGFK